MLEIKGLTKIYRSKTGEEVRALDRVDIAFPETGMVFILGKSGSGKSTLLNIMGGLDSYDSGEFIIKGKSSRDFAGSDFDAYRNTFIGFIFQEYNVLDDFTVGANIGLALELQGKKASPEAIGGILEQVGLTSFAKRKPNELSGGQKQRVAIARALVKDPQIIMADEPTGALDSATGKQIFDALKLLSKNKLVLVVSHDRDFAERYADRIVELSDGRIVSDVTKHEHESERVSAGIERIGGSILRIKAGYTLTAEDVRMINDYLAANASDVLVSGDGRVNDELRSAAGISETGATAVFEKTKENEDYSLKRYEKKDSKFIRSRLPIKDAVRIGASGLKHKKFRLVMTIFLSLIAFAMFGFADTLAAYQKMDATVNSIYDSNLRNASFSLGVRHTSTYADGDNYTYYNDATLNDEDIAYLKEQTGLAFVPVFTGGNIYSGGFSVSNAMTGYTGGTEVFGGKLNGLVAMTPDMLSSVGLQANAGRLPTASGELAITELLYRQFNEYGFKDTVTQEEVQPDKLTMADDGSKTSIIGKHLEIRSSNGSNMVLKIVGVVDTQFDYERYAAFLPSDENSRPDPNENNVLSQMVLQMELETEMGYGFHALGFAHEDDIDTLSKGAYTIQRELGTYMSIGDSNMQLSVAITRIPSSGEEKDGVIYETNIHSVAGNKALAYLPITWLDGEKTALGENEIILPLYMLSYLLPQKFTFSVDFGTLDTYMTAKYGEAWTRDRGDFSNLYDNLLSAAYAYYEGEGLTYEETVTKMQTDVFPFFLAELGIELPEEGMTILYGNYYELENLLRSMSNDKGLISVSVEHSQIESTLRYLHAEHAIKTHDLLNDPVFMGNMLAYYYGGDAGGRPADEIAREAVFYYLNYHLTWPELGYESNAYGLSGRELEALVKSVFTKNLDVDVSSLSQNVSFTLATSEWRDGTSVNTGSNSRSYKVVGFYDTSNYPYGELAISETLYNEFLAWRIENMGEYGSIEDVADHADGIWAYALAPLPKDKDVLEKLVAISYAEGDDLHFTLRNYVMDTLDTFNEFIEMGAKVFLYIGLGFAVFSALLLMNFISTSISYKKREIGVLRAVGARSSDVFKIFFSEALIIALINFVLSTVVVVAGVFTLNTLVHNEGLTVTLLSYGPRQFILMLVISIGVALLASFLPVNRIAKKKPVDAIKDR